MQVIWEQILKSGNGLGKAGVRLNIVTIMESMERAAAITKYLHHQF